MGSKLNVLARMAFVVLISFAVLAAGSYVLYPVLGAFGIGLSFAGAAGVFFGLYRAVGFGRRE